MLQPSFLRLNSRSFTSQTRLKRSQQHSDIPSFLQYAKSVSMSPEATAYIGTLYEYTVLSALPSLGMTLEHCGGPGDQGIDLRGKWNIANLSGEPQDRSRIFPVLVSCKAYKAKNGPMMIRELEGAIGSASRESIGLLATVSPCTRGAIQQIFLSPRALAYCYIKAYEDGGQISQFVWNRPAGVLLHGLMAEMRYSSGKEAGEGKLVFTFNGQALEGPRKSKKK